MTSAESIRNVTLSCPRARVGRAEKHSAARFRASPHQAVAGRVRSTEDADDTR